MLLGLSSHHKGSEAIKPKLANRSAQVFPTNNKIHLPSFKQAISPSVSNAPRIQKRRRKS